MPCYTDPHSYCTHPFTTEEEAVCDIRKLIGKIFQTNKTYKEERDEIKTVCDKRTDMLCRILSRIEGHESYHIHEFGDDIAKWWEEHKKWDEERKK